ncbi:hypothetical protein LWI28_019900 [Acer negundo]|uniref:Uncharacterized protein n=1 Tax=Acer negundo TaxID=4023 RepID=A0AAD5NZZ7_ACENE|nr:hypothetical protein LWI28_019900 [Acer negundo]
MLPGRIMVVNSRMTVSLEMEMDTVSVTVSWVEETLGLTKTKGSKVSTGKKDKLNPSSFQIQNSKYKVGVMDDGLFEEQEREEVSLRKDRGFDQNRRKKEGGCVKREGHSNCKIGKWAISISQIGKGKMKSQVQLQRMTIIFKGGRTAGGGGGGSGGGGGGQARRQQVVGTASGGPAWLQRPAVGHRRPPTRSFVVTSGGCRQRVAESVSDGRA